MIRNMLWVAMLLGLTAAQLPAQDSAQSKDSTSTAMTQNPATSANSASASATATEIKAFDSPIIWGKQNDLLLALLLTVLFGALGGFAADLVGDGGSIAFIRVGRTRLVLGYLGKLIIGAVAALITVGLTPPEHWVTLIAVALAAGVGGEAIVLAIVKGKQAEREKADKKIAEERAEDARKTAMLKVATLRDSVLAMHRVQRGVAAEQPAMMRGGPAPDNSFESAVATLADKLIDELADMQASIEQTVRAIVRDAIGREPGNRSLKDNGATADAIHVITTDIASTWPETGFADGDVVPADTVKSLTGKVRERMQ